MQCGAGCMFISVQNLPATAYTRPSYEKRHASILKAVTQ